MITLFLRSRKWSDLECNLSNFSGFSDLKKEIGKFEIRDLEKEIGKFESVQSLELDFRLSDESRWQSRNDPPHLS